MDTIFDDHPELGITGFYQNDSVDYKWTQYTGSDSSVTPNDNEEEEEEKEEEQEEITDGTAVTLYESIAALINSLSSSVERETITVNGTTIATVVMDSGTKAVTDGGRARSVNESGDIFILDGDVCTFSSIK